MPTDTNQPPDGATEWAADAGKFYCPGCGARFDTAGECSGTAEAGHEPILVEAVKAKADKDEKADKAAAK